MLPSDYNEELMMKPRTDRSDTKKVFDVSRPGRSAVSATSRPVIVGHKPQVKDPMVAEEDGRQLMNSKKRVTIEPTGAPAIPAHTDNKVDESKPEAPIVHTPQKDSEFPADGLASVATSSVVDTPATPAEDEPRPDTVPSASIEAEKPTEIADESNKVEAPVEVTPSESVAVPAPPEPTTGVVFDEAPTEVPVARSVRSNEPLPELPPDEPLQQKIVISHHADANKSGAIIMIIALLLLGVFIFNVLLDAGIIVIKGIPHTDLF